MIVHKLVLRFVSANVGQPIVYHLVKKYDLVVNILKAEINPHQQGYVVLELSGEKDNYDQGMEYLKSLEVEIEPLSKKIAWNSERCLHCGACTTFCPVGALYLVKPQLEVKFDEEKCIVCESCLDVCMARAVEVRF
jgi:ferredoxin